MVDYLRDLFQCRHCQGTGAGLAFSTTPGPCGTCDGLGYFKENVEIARKAHDPRTIALKLLGKERIAFALRIVEANDHPIPHYVMTRTYKASGQYPQRDSSHFARCYRVKYIERSYGPDQMWGLVYGIPSAHKNTLVRWIPPRLPEVVKSLQDGELHDLYEFYESKTFDPVSAKEKEPWRIERIDQRCHDILRDEIKRRKD